VIFLVHVYVLLSSKIAFMVSGVAGERGKVGARVPERRGVASAPFLAFLQSF